MATESTRSSYAGRTVAALTPWGKSAHWGIVLAEGLIALAAGIYMLVAPANTELLLGWFLALALAVMGALELLEAYRMGSGGRPRQAAFVQGLVGLVTGVVLVILLNIEGVSAKTGHLILGLGAVVFGLIALYGLFVRRHGVRGPRGGFVVGLFFLAIGVLLLLARFGVSDVSTYVLIIAVLLVVCGVLLGGSSFFLRNRAAKARAEAVEKGDPQ